MLKDLLMTGSERSGNGVFYKGMACVLGILTCMPSHATYNANIVGNVTQILTYNSGVVLFSLDTQPTSNGACTPQFFELDPSSTNTPNDAAAVNRLYARLAQAYALGQPVNIGFDNAANCGVSGYITVYRIG